VCEQCASNTHSFTHSLALSADSLCRLARSLARSLSYQVLRCIDFSERCKSSLSMQMAQQYLVDSRWVKAQQLSARVSPKYARGGGGSGCPAVAVAAMAVCSLHCTALHALLCLRVRYVQEGWWSLASTSFRNALETALQMQRAWLACRAAGVYIVSLLCDFATLSACAGSFDLSLSLSLTHTHTLSLSLSLPLRDRAVAAQCARPASGVHRRVSRGATQSTRQCCCAARRPALAVYAVVV
jgi:hypothetical protein